jgi:Ankyrin repeats (3 copies)/Ankyrin repeat
MKKVVFLLIVFVENVYGNGFVIDNRYKSTMQESSTEKQRGVESDQAFAAREDYPYLDSFDFDPMVTEFDDNNSDYKNNLELLKEKTAFLRTEISQFADNGITSHYPKILTYLVTVLGISWLSAVFYKFLKTPKDPVRHVDSSSNSLGQSKIGDNRAQRQQSVSKVIINQIPSAPVMTGGSEVHIETPGMAASRLNQEAPSPMSKDEADDLGMKLITTIMMKESSLEDVKSFIRPGVDVNIQNTYGKAPLHQAVAHNKKEVVKLLLKHNADIHVQDHYGNTPLHIAVSCGYGELANLLLDQGAKIDARNENTHGYTPLHLAVLQHKPNMVVLLLNRGANTNIQDNSGQTPFELARSSGYGEIVDLFPPRKPSGLTSC